MIGIRRLGIVACAATALVTSFSTSAASLTAPAAGGSGSTVQVRDDMTVALKVAEAALGAGVREVSTPVRAGSVTVAPARVHGQPVTTLSATAQDRVSVVAVLTKEGADEVSFDLSLNGGSIEKAADGALLVTRMTPAGASVSAVIAPPWAKDASGKALPTHYEVAGATLIQNVDTTGAQYPVVADPTIFKTGFFGVVPVVYVKFTRTETVTIRNRIRDSGVAVAAGSTCGLIPNALAKVACGIVVASKYSDFKNAVDDAYAVKGRCLRARVPLNAGAIAIPALDFYTHAC